MLLYVNELKGLLLILRVYKYLRQAFSCVINKTSRNMLKYLSVRHLELPTKVSIMHKFTLLPSSTLSNMVIAHEIVSSLRKAFNPQGNARMRLFSAKYLSIHPSMHFGIFFTKDSGQTFSITIWLAISVGRTWANFA